MVIKTYDEILVLEDKIDKDGILYYSFYLKPPVWTANTEVIEGDIISPTTPTGYYYIVTNSGITGATEPLWATVKNGKTTDNTAIFKAANNTSYLKSSATLNTVTSSFSTSDNVPIVDSTISANGYANVKVGPVPTGVTSFTLTFKFWVNTGFTEEEYDEQSIKIKVKDN